MFRIYRKILDSNIITILFKYPILIDKRKKTFFYKIFIFITFFFTDRML